MRTELLSTLYFFLTPHQSHRVVMVKFYTELKQVWGNVSKLTNNIIKFSLFQEKTEC